MDDKKIDARVLEGWVGVLLSLPTHQRINHQGTLYLIAEISFPFLSLARFFISCKIVAKMREWQRDVEWGLDDVEEKMKNSRSLESSLEGQTKNVALMMRLLCE